MRTQLGTLLHLPSFHHFYSLEVTLLEQEQAPSEKRFILVFLEEEEAQVVDFQEERGASHQLLTAQHFSLEQLIEGIVPVPLTSLSSLRILELPKTSRKRGIEPHLLRRCYPDEQQLLDQLAPLPSNVYDPYRYSYTIEEKDEKEPRSGLIDRKEYEGITDFHPFLQTRNGNVYSISCDYWDGKSDKPIKLYVMGWYFYEQQLKISWRPSHSRKSRWRSSIVSVDKKTDRYFFQGELHKKGSYPIFLDKLYPKRAHYQERIDEQFRAFLSIIEEQKEAAKLRIR